MRQLAESKATIQVRAAIKDQYHAALAMLRDAILVCPDALWVAGKEPRSFWRIAYHALFYTLWYLHPNIKRSHRWEAERKGCESLAAKPSKKNSIPYSKEELLEFWSLVDGFVDGAVDAMNLEAPGSGFWWYKMPKLNHQFVNIRHIQQHTGQLCELLHTLDIDTRWLGGRPV